MSNRLKSLIQVSLAFSSLVTGAQTPSRQMPGIGQQRDNVVLGVLEDISGEYAGEPDFRAVRAVFRNIDDRWQAFPTSANSYRDLQTLPSYYPKEMTWIIAFDGRELGAITSRTRRHFASYSEIGIEHIISHSYIPAVGRRSTA